MSFIRARRALRPYVEILLGLFALPILFFCALRSRHTGKTDLIWGGEALVSYKYWSRALSTDSHPAYTLIDALGNNLFKRTDFDMTYDDLAPKWVTQRWLWQFFRHYVAAAFIIKRAAVYHCAFSGGPLGATVLRWLEAQLYGFAGVKTVVASFGGDFWRYSTILDSTMRHALLANYPELGRNEKAIDRFVKYWTKHANVVVASLATDGMGYWDTLVMNPVCVDLSNWPLRQDWSTADGVNKPVKIVHAPNHRGVKGTEFFSAAVTNLARKGLQIEFVLLERIPNTQVLEHLRSADICLEQCASGMGYGLFAIESMASGASVVSNLEDPYRHNVHRQYGYLNECPLVSTDVDHLEFTIEKLVRTPQLRQQLGTMGRTYVEKYHSYKTAKFFFGLIHDKLLRKPELDILTPFHPVSSPYLSSTPKINPPLHQNRLY